MKQRIRTASPTAQRRQASENEHARQAAHPAVDHSPRMTAQRERIDSSFDATAQRVGEDEELQMKADPALQRAAEEEEPLQRKAEGGAPPNQTGMPDALKSGVEALSGMDLSDVRVHANSSQPQQLAAHAYAQGSDIHVAPGQEQHLPHEAWHVVQQRQGRVQPTTQMAGVSVNDDQSLEAEADAMGARALSEGTQGPVAG
jgi:hypothetical protein